MLGPVNGGTGAAGGGNSRGGSCGGSKNRIPSLSLLGSRRGSKDSRVSITEEDEDVDQDQVEFGIEMEGQDDHDPERVNSKNPRHRSTISSSSSSLHRVRTPEANAGPGPSSTILSGDRGKGPHSPSPSPGRVERRRKAGALNRVGSGSGEGSSRDSSPSKVSTSVGQAKTRAQRGMLGERQMEVNLRDQVQTELGLRDDARGKGKGKGRLMEVDDSSDEDCPDRLTGIGMAAGAHGKEHHRHKRLKVLVLGQDEDQEGEEKKAASEPVVLRSPGSRSGRRKRGLSGGHPHDAAVVGSGSVKSRRSSRSSATRPDQGHGQDHGYMPDLSMDADERTRLLGPPDLQLPSVPSPYPHNVESEGKPASSSSSAEIAIEPGSVEERAILDADSETPEGGVWYRGPLFEAGWKLGLMFLLFTGVIVGVGWFALPAMNP
jgi:hypothetical protein